MDKESKIFVAGASGMVGSAIVCSLLEQGYTNIIGSYHSRKPDTSLFFSDEYNASSITDHSSLITHKLDLTDQHQVRDFFAEHRPEYVFLAAAQVGGILANNKYRADFIYLNTQMQNNVIEQSYEHEVKKLLFLGSSCIYPKECPQPMREEHLLTGPLEYTNEPYATAKISGMKMCESYNLQYGTNFVSVMPTNLYGPGDNFDLETSHVLPALIRKFHLGKCLEQEDWQAIREDLDKRPIAGVDGSAADKAIIETLASYGISLNASHDSRLTPYESSSLITDNSSQVTVQLWGTGTPKREFMYSQDMARACLHVMNQVDFSDIVRDRNGADPSQASEVRNCHVNIGTGREISISDLADLASQEVGFQGNVDFDPSMPDGTPRKLLDVSRLQSLGYEAETGLKEGVRKLYAWYRSDTSIE